MPTSMSMTRGLMQEAQHEYGITPINDLKENHYDAIIMAVAHDEFVKLGVDGIKKLGKASHVLFDVKNVLPKDMVDARL